MEQYRGRSIFPKIAMGPVFYLEKRQVKVPEALVENAEEETGRFYQACREAAKELEVLRQKALAEAGADSAEVFEAHQMLLEDQGFTDAVCSLIREQKRNAVYAVNDAKEQFAGKLAQMEDPYMQARAVDIRDVSDRLIKLLAGDREIKKFPEEPFILAAEDLSPGETMQMDRTKILGFVTQEGSANSHTAILARAMNIPAVMGVKVKREWDKKLCVIDGFAGRVTIEPQEAYLQQIRERLEKERQDHLCLQELKGKPTVTKGGRRIRLYANIGNVADADSALAADAEGIGLFRSEFLYLESAEYPSEEAQFEAYKAVAEKMGGRKVIIRTLDIGADKKAPYFHLQPEENPAMGYRAIRICLGDKKLFLTQLRALLRASVHGDLAVMFPMIVSVEEVLQAKALLKQAKEELQAEKIPCRDVEVGVMIETPAAVLISDRLAKEVDFFSIGTNDLTQYMLAADRQNPLLDGLYDARHPAVLKAVKMTVENGHREGIWVGICGELAADTDFTYELIKMGVDELSVSPAFILPVRKAVRSLS